MALERYSAVDIFGIPLDNPEDVFSKEEVLGLMRAHDIEPQEVPQELTEITPHFWRHNSFQYFVSRPQLEGPALVELLPRTRASADVLLASGVRGPELVGTGLRSIQIPYDTDFMPLLGGSPRFAGALCLHELIIYQD